MAAREVVLVAMCELSRFPEGGVGCAGDGVAGDCALSEAKIWCQTESVSRRSPAQPAPGT